MTTPLKQQYAESLERKDAANRRSGGLDLREDQNINLDLDGLVERTAAMAASKWRGNIARAAGFRGDTQVANASACALRSILTGFYLKPPTQKFWASGDYIQITDQGAHPGADALEYNTQGARYEPIDDGITQEDQDPERAVTQAQDVTTQKFKEVKDVIELRWHDVQKAELQGYDLFELMGENLRRAHEFNLNNLIRRGNANHGLTGIVNHPGIRRRAATTDWGGSGAAAIYDEYNACINDMWSSATEDGVPQHSVLPNRQFDYFTTEQFSPGGTDTTLRTYIEMNRASQGHTILHDPGMATASSDGGPAALFYTNDPALVRVTMPYYMRVLEPHQKNQWVIQIHIISRFAGVQVFDVDRVLVVDGDPANWEGQNP